MGGPPRCDESRAARGGAVDLLHVMPPADFQTLGSVADRMKEERRAEGEQLLTKLAELRGDKLTVESETKSAADSPKAEHHKSDKSNKSERKNKKGKGNHKESQDDNIFEKIVDVFRPKGENAE